MYDGNGYRVTSSYPAATEYFIRGADGNTLVAFNDLGEIVAEYLYAGGRQIGKVMPGGSGDDVRFFHPDHLGSAIVITNDTGAVTWRGEYMAFGEPVSSTGDADRHRFTQHELDLTTNLVYAKARYYHPRIGRFLSIDPVGGSPGSSQSWNRYAYVRNNPLAFIDPSGEAEVSVVVSTFIPADSVSVPGLGFAAEGDGRGFDPNIDSNGRFRTFQQVTVETDPSVPLNSKGALKIEKATGASRMTLPGGGMLEGQAGGGSIGAAVLRLPDGNTKVMMIGNESLPLIPLAPGISYDLSVTLSPGGDVVDWTANKDTFPAHEAYVRSSSGTQVLYQTTPDSRGPITLAPGIGDETLEGP